MLMPHKEVNMKLQTVWHDFVQPVVNKIKTISVPWICHESNDYEVF